MAVLLNTVHENNFSFTGIAVRRAETKKSWFTSSEDMCQMGPEPASVFN
jgi:hypothetical protein